MGSEALYVGLMSGTSLDGVDAALVNFSGPAPICLATCYRPYSRELRAEALALQQPSENELHRSAILGNRLADAYAQCTDELLRKANRSAAQVLAIGCHGQTIRHVPAEGYTLQLNNPARLAELTGIAVVADFRSRDLAAGGQGAPLVPAFHDQVFRSTSRHRIIVNIGGIANITDLAPDQATRGFDCGPGNVFLDAWTERHLGKPYDEEGAWSRTGQVLQELLTRLLRHTYFLAAPPKSCGREQFYLGWLDAQLEGNETARDVQATLTEFTATTITSAINRWCGRPDELYVCGGGAHNEALMAALRRSISNAQVATTDALGLPADWVEAIAFAWLAHQALSHQPGNLPEVTGARGPRVLGALYPA